MGAMAEGREIRITEMDLFSGLDHHFLGKIAESACSEVEYTQGMAIFNAGENAKDLFILEQGVVELTIGDGKTVYSLTDPGEIFGWSSIVEDSLYTATAEAKTDIQAVKIDAAKMNRHLSANPTNGLTIYRRLASIFHKRLSSMYGKFSMGGW
jgi:CRP-like cAMP-binding protein